MTDDPHAPTHTTTPAPSIDPTLEAIMTRLADGHMEAVAELLDRYGHRIRGVVRRIVKGTGRRDILDDQDEIDGLTIDAALVVVKYAGTWKPWGALPWTWAYRAIEEVVWSGIGHNTTELEEWHQVGNRTPVGVPSPRSARIADVERLAEGRPELALFLEVLATEVSERDYGVVLEYELQKADGVRAPSETTALLTGLKAPNVRQVFRRSRKKLVRRIDADPGLEVLRGFWFLASSD